MSCNCYSLHRLFKGKVINIFNLILFSGWWIQLFKIEGGKVGKCGIQESIILRAISAFEC